MYTLQRMGRLEGGFFNFVKKTLGGVCIGLAGWRLKPARRGSGRLALDPIAALQGDRRSRLKRGDNYIRRASCRQVYLQA